MTNYRVNFVQREPTYAYYEVDQIHSNIICPISEIKNSPKLLSGDGIFWHDDDLEQNESIAIKTADCLSILVHNGPEHYLIHAGWRGIYNGILRQVNNFNEVIFYPSIMPCCFEVTDDFLDHFPSSRNFSKKRGKLYFNLQAEAIDQLKTISNSVKIIQNDKCTYCSETKFHSFRRDKTTLRNYTLVTKQ